MLLLSYYNCLSTGEPRRASIRCLSCDAEAVNGEDTYRLICEFLPNPKEFALRLIALDFAV